MAIKYEISLNINNHVILHRVSRTRLIYVTFRELVPLLFQELVQRQHSGPGSSVGITTDGPGSNPGGDEIFRPSKPALGSTQPPVKLIPVLYRW